MNLVGFVEPGVVCPFHALSAAQQTEIRTASVESSKKERTASIESGQVKSVGVGDSAGKEVVEVEREVERGRLPSNKSRYIAVL